MASAAAEPHFTITSVDAPNKVTDGESYTVKVMIKNDGYGDGTARVVVYVDGRKYAEKVVQIPKGQSRVVEFSYTATYPEDVWTFEVHNTATGKVDDARTV